MANKICNKCGSRVHASVNYCPYCKSSSFRNQNEIKLHDNSLKYQLFYWKQGSYYVLSKTKVAAIVAFAFFAASLATSSIIGAILISPIIAALTYVVGFSVHKVLNRDNLSQTLLENNDFGLVNDLKHLFFYWQIKSTGQYVPSKTKTITVLLFMLFAAIAAAFNPSSLIAVGIFSVICSIPTFTAGYAVHRLTTADPIAKVLDSSKPKVEQVRAPANTYHEYTAKLNELKHVFDHKESNVRNLIDKRFEPPQLTNTRFMNSVDNCSELFNTQADEIESIIDLAGDLTPRIKEEIQNKFDIMESMIDKLNQLANELIISIEEDKDGFDVENHVSEMENIIKSVKEYLS